MTNEYEFLKKQRYEYYKDTNKIVDNELDDFVDDVVERLNAQDFNKNELLKVKQIQDERIAELKEQLAEKQKQVEKLNNTLILNYDTREWRKICEIQCEHKQCKDAYKELRKEYNERVCEIKQAHILNDRLGEKIKNLEQQLKSQPAEIVEKINGEIYTRMVVECKKTKYTDINLLLDTILKDYQK